MADIFNRHAFPPGGWAFRQPQTGWVNPHPLGYTFDQTVTEIIKHRKGNMAIVSKFNLPLDPGAVGNELESFTRTRLGIPASVPKSVPLRPIGQSSGVVAAAIERLKKLASGGALLMEWENSGMAPEAREIAEERAAICAGCPKNDKRDLSEFFTVPASELIRKRLGRLNDMNLTTSKDPELNVCQACLCPLRLKVYTPKDLILKRIKPKELEELDPRCWILKLK